MEPDRRILIVDTDRPTLFALTEALRLRLGTLSIDTAGSGEMAAALTASFRYHIIIYLCDMPGSADEALAVFSQWRQFLPRETLILRAGPKLRDRSLESVGSWKCLRGPDGVLESPIDLEHFLTVVQAAWSERGTRYNLNHATTFAAEQQTALSA